MEHKIHYSVVWFDNNSGANIRHMLCSMEECMAYITDVVMKKENASGVVKIEKVEEYSMYI